MSTVPCDSTVSMTASNFAAASFVRFGASSLTTTETASPIVGQSRSIVAGCRLSTFHPASFRATFKEPAVSIISWSPRKKNCAPHATLIATCPLNCPKCLLKIPCASSTNAFLGPSHRRSFAVDRAWVSTDSICDLYALASWRAPRASNSALPATDLACSDCWLAVPATILARSADATALMAEVPSIPISALRSLSILAFVDLISDSTLNDQNVNPTSPATPRITNKAPTLVCHRFRLSRGRPVIHSLKSGVYSKARPTTTTAVQDISTYESTVSLVERIDRDASSALSSVSRSESVMERCARITLICSAVLPKIDNPGSAQPC